MSEEKTTPSPLDEQLCVALYAASRTMTGLYREFLTPLGLTYPQFAVLLALWETDGLTVGELGDLLFLDSGTLSPLLRRLEKSEHVRRERSADDARVVRIFLTEKGDHLREDAAHLTSCLADEIPLDDGEIETLRELAKKLVVESNAQEDHH